MRVKQRIVLTVSERDTFWEIEVERNGVWHSSVYAGSSPSLDDAFVTAKRYLLANARAANGPVRNEDCALLSRRRS